MRGQRSVPGSATRPATLRGSEQLVRSKGWFATAAVLVSLALAAAPSAGTAQQPTTTPPDAGTGAAAGAPAALGSIPRCTPASRPRGAGAHSWERSALEQQYRSSGAASMSLAGRVTESRPPGQCDRARRSDARRQLVVSDAECTWATATARDRAGRAGDQRAMLRRRLIDLYERGPLYSTEALLTADSFGEPWLRDTSTCICSRCVIRLWSHGWRSWAIRSPDSVERAGGAPGEPASRTGRRRRAEEERFGRLESGTAGAA